MYCEHVDAIYYYLIIVVFRISWFAFKFAKYFVLPFSIVAIVAFS